MFENNIYVDERNVHKAAVFSCFGTCGAVPWALLSSVEDLWRL